MTPIFSHIFSNCGRCSRVTLRKSVSKNFPSRQWGLSGRPCMCRPGIVNPLRCEQKFQDIYRGGGADRVNLIVDFTRIWPKNWQNLQSTSKYSASTNGGPRSRVHARGTLRSAPHRHERKFSGTRVCRIAFKHLPQPLRSHIQSFRTPRQVFLGNI